jgi:hypothetical protein
MSDHGVFFGCSILVLAFAFVDLALEHQWLRRPNRDVSAGRMEVSRSGERLQEGAPPVGGVDPEQALVTLAETKVTRRKDARRFQAVR